MTDRTDPSAEAARLEIRDVGLRFGRLQAVDGISLTLAAGEIVAVLGKSGCGKSSLLRLAAGLEAPDAGTIRIDGTVVAGAGRMVPAEARGVGLMFQDHALFPHLDLLDNVRFGLHRLQRARALAVACARLTDVGAVGDRDVARDIAADICEVGLANSYYAGLMRSGRGGPDQVKWGEAIKVVLPTFDTGGTHVNVSGAVVTRNAPNRDAAVGLLEYLVSDEAQAQAHYAKADFEYPVKAGVAVDPLLAVLGPLTIDATPLVDVVKNRKAASLLADKVGFDN